MGFLDKFKSILSPSRTPIIVTKEDLISFFEEVIGDYETSLFLADVADHIGREGYLQFQQGGQGEPFDVEYQYTPKADRRSRKDVIPELDKLTEMIEKTISERERLEKQRAELFGGLCTILINVESNEEFEQKGNLLERAYSAFKVLVRDK